MSSTCGIHGWRHALDECPKCKPEAREYIVPKEWQTRGEHSTATDVVVCVEKAAFEQMRSQMNARVGLAERLFVERTNQAMELGKQKLALEAYLAVLEKERDELAATLTDPSIRIKHCMACDEKVAALEKERDKFLQSNIEKERHIEKLRMKNALLKDALKGKK